MKFAVSYNGGDDPDRLAAYARHAEACGFEGLYLTERLATKPGMTLHGVEVAHTRPFLDPLVALTYVAATTERLLLGTGVLLLPYRHPVVLAKQLATIDVLSKGRLRLLTVGVSSFEVDAEAAGIDFRTRGRRTDEAIDVLRLLWSAGEEGATFEGEFFRFENLIQSPRPTPLPIHIGGASQAAARRTGLRGDGFFAGGALTEEERAAQWDTARATAKESGRDAEALEYTRWAGIGMTEEQRAALEAAGVTRVVVTPTADSPAEQHDQLSEFANRHIKAG